jgi:hypothetical protein
MPPIQASASVQNAGSQAAQAAAAAAGSMGLDNTVKTGPQGAAKALTTGGKALLGG